MGNSNEVLGKTIGLEFGTRTAGIVCRVTKNQELDVMERSATSETVEEPIPIVGIREAGDVGAPVILDSFAPTNGNDKRTVKG
jgi:hypothetical protein